MVRLDRHTAAGLTREAAMQAPETRRRWGRWRGECVRKTSAISRDEALSATEALGRPAWHDSQRPNGPNH